MFIKRWNLKIRDWLDGVTTPYQAYQLDFLLRRLFGWEHPRLIAEDYFLENDTWYPLTEWERGALLSDDTLYRLTIEYNLYLLGYRKTHPKLDSLNQA